MKSKPSRSAAQLNRRKYLTTILVAAVAGIAGVAVSARKATIIYAGTEQIGRNSDTIRLISQITAAVATLILTFMVMLMVDVMNNKDKADRIASLRRNNITALIAAPMIDILTLIGASELIQTPMQADVPSGSSLATICTIAGVIDAFMAHAVFGALALSFISFQAHPPRKQGVAREWSSAADAGGRLGCSADNNFSAAHSMRCLRSDRQRGRKRNSRGSRMLVRTQPCIYRSAGHLCALLAAACGKVRGSAYGRTAGGSKRHHRLNIEKISADCISV